jgi:type I restriction enzyme S subunit
MVWPLVSIGKFTTTINRSEKVHPERSYRLLGMKSQIGGPFLRETKLGSEISAAKFNKVHTGDFIYSRLFAWSGSFGVVPAELDGSFVSNEFPIFQIDNNQAHPSYVLYWFGLPSTQKAVEADCFGSTPGTRNRYKETFFLKLTAPLPPLAEQRRIVVRLDHVAGLVAARRLTIAAAEADMQALLAKAFARAIEGAPRRPMGEVAPLVRRPVEIDPSGTYTEIGVRSFYNGVFHRRTLAGSEFSWQKLFWVEEGDLVFSNLMAWERAIAVAGAEDAGTVGNHRMLTCAVNPLLSTPGFLMAYFQTPEGFANVLGLSPGTIARNKTLSAKKFPTMEVPVPPLETQRWFDRLQAKARQIRDIRAGTAKDVDALLPAMLHEVFSDAANAA